MPCQAECCRHFKSCRSGRTQAWRTNSEYASNQTVYNGRNTSSGKALACWFFTCTNLKQTVSNLKSMGRDHAIRCNRIQRKVQLISVFARGNCRFPPLPRIEVWLGLVHMKKQQIEGVVMAWLSPVECGHRDVFKVCLEFVHMKTQYIEGVTKKVLIPQWNELRADINKVCLRFVHMKIQQKEEEQSVANNRTGEE